MPRLVILGAGGHGAVVADVATAISLWSNAEIVFLDDRYSQSNQFWHWTISGTLADFRKFINNNTFFVVAIGDNAMRHRWQARIQEDGGRMATLIHPSAVISQRSTLGPGTVVFPAAVINIGSVLGAGCIINTSAVVEHDCRLGDAVHICPNAGLAGGVKIGARSMIGIGATIRQCAQIGSDAVIGAGAVVVGDIPNGVTAYGVPARVKSE